MRPHLRIAGRIALAAVVLPLAGLFAVQTGTLVYKDVALWQQVRETNREIGALRTHRAQQLHSIDRLRNDHGAVPEIHDRLHFVKPGESIIYLTPTKDVHGR